ncbi:hypothetical protein [Conexibacter arvalis]|uniref:Uncharacterized protein n=1 Tax=Conexibacter arvalis TaxID=912552 RepID=A0A840II99_9ACTN|nr:hypothetical protein [Conexibacter arvalis]MBB4663931.1 hypothetical protein [Conexibacter arvalis]
MTESEADERFVLLLGSTTNDTVLSKLKAAGILYVEKRLESNPENWRTITGMLQNEQLLAVIVKLTGKNLAAAMTHDYCEAARALADQLGRVRHMVLVHESLLGPDERVPPPDALVMDPDDERIPWFLSRHDHPFARPSDELLAKAFEYLRSANVSVLPYETNAELSVISAAFLDDYEQNLLFRIYVPAGRLYSDEADKLMSLFHDWMHRVKRQRVRRGGYETPDGQVFEFFGESAVSAGEVAVQFNDFSEFLDLCLANNDEAASWLVRSGIEPRRADALALRYAKEGRRIDRDMRQARDELLVRLRYELEEELSDTFDETVGASDLDRLLRQLVPEPGMGVQALSPSISSGSSRGEINVSVVQQVFEHVEGTVIGTVTGTANLGTNPRELLSLVERFADADQRQALTTSIYEVEDAGAPADKRIVARQRLKKFLADLGGKVEDSVIRVMQAYLESRIGI